MGACFFVFWFVSAKQTRKGNLMKFKEAIKAVCTGAEVDMVVYSPDTSIFFDGSGFVTAIDLGAETHIQHFVKDDIWLADATPVSEPEEPFKPSSIQQIVIDSYPDGWLILEDGGDTLFSFLMVELSENEDCDTVEEAISRLDAAIADINLVKEALLLQQLPASSTPH